MDSRGIKMPAPPVGVVEALSGGFEIVAKQLLLVLLPLLVDLLLWFGPRISLQPAAQELYQQVWLPYLEGQPAQAQEFYKPTTAILTDLAARPHLQYLPMVGVPSVLLVQLVVRPYSRYLIGLLTHTVLDPAWPTTDLPFEYQPPVLTVHSTLGWAAIAISLTLLGTLLGTLYLGMIAYQVRDGRLRIVRLLANLPNLWLQLALFVIVVPMTGLVMLTPFALIGAALASVNQALAALALFVGLFVVAWLIVFLVFTVHGVLMNERGLLAALWDSVRLVQWNTSATVMLLVVVFVIVLGLWSAWIGAETDSWLMLAAFVGQAFSTTGLLAATFVFYKDRYRHWREMRAELLAELERYRARQGG
jgi:hypothetical protein